ncbi:MAG TPA: hypothetical protein VFQ49_11610 [Actinomycetes bacterium]|nr:hypothetical protein [Actinomycetes bacterium]
MVAPSSPHWAGDSPASAPGLASSSGYRARAKRPTVTEDAPVEVASGARTFGTPRRWRRAGTAAPRPGLRPARTLRNQAGPAAVSTR